MINVVLVMFFQAAAGQAAAPPAETPQTTVTVTADAPKAAKEICKYEFQTGSRTKRIKVCNTPGQSSDGAAETKLLRQLDRAGDAAPVSEGSMRN